MDPISDSGVNPTNNPRIDLLHNTGNNQQLAGAAGNYGPGPVFQPSPVAEQKPQPVAPVPSREAASYVAAAQANKPETPVPLPPAPKPTIMPEPKIASKPPDKQGQPNSPKPLLIILIVVLIVAAVGAGIWLWLSHRNNQATPAQTPVAVTPVTPTNLSQADSKGASIATGGTTGDSKVIFHFTVATSATSGSLTPQVELEPAGTTFTGTSNLTGGAVSANGGTMQFNVDSDTLKSGSYHWQARVGTGDKQSSWVIFGGDATAIAFTVSQTAPATPTVTTVGGAAVANPTVVTSNRPVIIGKADPNVTINVALTPDSQKFTATADASGSWTLTPNADIPNGQHQLSITATNASGVASTPLQISLSVNPATAADTTPSTTATPTPAPTTTPSTGGGTAAATTSPSATSAANPATTSNKLAPTGDNTTLVSFASVGVMVLAAIGIMAIRRRYDSL